MARKYFTLIQRIDGRWYPQFGDYDRAVVDEEHQGMCDAHDAPRVSDLKVISSGAFVDQLRLETAAVEAAWKKSASRSTSRSPCCGPSITSRSCCSASRSTG